jgi:DNA-binding IclR family transcriptional regulator
MANESSRRTQSIQRAALLIREVAAHNRAGVRLIDLARGLGLERPTIYRLLRSLEDERWITQDPGSKRYFLGAGLYEVGLSAARRFNPRDLCQPVLDRVAAKTGDTVYLNMLSDSWTVCLNRRSGGYPIKVHTLEVGDRRPLGAGAGGLAILSAFSDDRVKELLAQIHTRRGLHPWKTLTTDALLSAVQRARKVGYALYEGELVDLRALGVAIKRRNGEPYAAISVATIRSRIRGRRIDELAKLLKQAAVELANLLNQQDLADWSR